MAEFRISGVWKNANGVIVAYAFHTVTQTGCTRAVKKTKAEAIALLETRGSIAYTWIWNYETEGWDDGAQVEVVNGVNGKYLRSYHDRTRKDNLSHLINYNWIVA